MHQTASGNPSAAPLPEWGLFVREPFATRIVLGFKTWEIRRRSTPRRGRIGIVSERGLMGTVDLVDVRGPFRVEELMRHVDRHRAPISLLERYADGRALWAWVLRDAVAFPEPVRVHRGRGPVVWRRLRA